MMDRKKLVERCLGVLYGNRSGEAIKVHDRAEQLADLLMELTGEKAKIDADELRLSAKTRGQEVADEFVSLAENYNPPSVYFGKELFQTLYHPSREIAAISAKGMRENLAALIDAERADAAKGERNTVVDEFRRQGWVADANGVKNYQQK
jgi:hypothetical protein